MIDVQLFFILNNLAGKNAALDWSILFLAEYLQYFLVAGFLIYVFRAIAGKREKIIAVVAAFAAAILSRFVFTEIIRFFYHHPRPFLVLPVRDLIPENSYSFPSGHASFFFAFSTIVYSYNKKLGIFFFIASFLMGLARVAAGVHYPSDIAGGLIVGIISGFIILKLKSKFLSASR